MSSEFPLNIGNVSIVRGADGGYPPDFPTSNVVGATQWSDDDDASYATITAGHPPSDPLAITGDVAYVVPLILDAEAATAIDIVSTVRVALLAGPDDADVVVTLGTPTNGGGFQPGPPDGGDIAVFATFHLTSADIGAGPQDLSFSFYDNFVGAGVDPADVIAGVRAYVAAFSDGVPSTDSPQNIVAQAGAGLSVAEADLVTRIYEVTVTFVHEGGALTAPVVVRLYPRDDALGLGSAPRLYPPPRGSRVVGGFQ